MAKNYGEKFFKSLAILSLLLSFSLLFSILYKSIIVGLNYMDISFLTSEVENAGRSGGIYPIILSTIYILFLSLVVTIPLSLACAIQLNELRITRSPYYSILNKLFHILASLPSIVVGLFGYLFFSVYLNLGYSLLAGSLTISFMSLPILTRNIELSLKNIPFQYYQVNSSLGIGYLSSYFKVYLPIVKSQLQAGLVLSMGRVLAETAALLFTSGYGVNKPESLFDSARTLSIHIYELSMNIVGGDQNAYKTVFILMLLVVSCNLLSRKFLKNKVLVEL